MYPLRFRYIAAFAAALCLLCTLSSCFETVTDHGGSSPVVIYTLPEVTGTYAPRVSDGTFTPGYSSDPVRIDKSRASSFLYWRDTLKTDAERSAYDRIGVMQNEIADNIDLTTAVTFDQVGNIYMLYRLDHPEYFFSASTYTGKGNADAVTTFEAPSIYPKDQVLSMRKEIEETVKTLLAGIPDGATDFEAEEYLYGYLAENVVYDASAPHAHDLYGALVDRRCVCEGFAEAFQYLMSRVGIPALSITGSALHDGKNERHKWNAVMIGGRWYAVDVTWAAGAQGMRYLYLNDSERILATHTPDDALASALPAFTATEASYMAYYGLVFDENDFDDVFLRALEHFTADMGDAPSSVNVRMRGCDAEAASFAVGEISDPGSARVYALVALFSERRGGIWTVYGDARPDGERGLEFTFCRVGILDGPAQSSEP